MYQLTFDDLTDFLDCVPTSNFFYTIDEFNKDFKVGSVFKFRKSGFTICITNMCYDFNTFQFKYLVGSDFFGDRCNYVFPKKWVYSIFDPI